MGKITLGGCMLSLKRSFSNAYIGWAEGDITHLKNGGVMQVLLEGDQIVCFSVGLDDIIIRREDVASFECVAQNIKKDKGNNDLKDCNCYSVTLKNGEVGTFTIFVEKVAAFTNILK